ncbi:MAG: hypothetical protein ACQETE_09065 [Bacteroidota bacterium]
MIKTFPVSLNLTIAVLFFAIAVGCNQEDEQQQFESSAFQTPNNYTPMTLDGKPDGDPDEDDWRISPMYSGLVRFYSDENVRYPYPNSVATDQRVTVELYISLDALNGIIVGGYNDQDEFIRLFSTYDTPNGLTSFTINPTDIAQFGGQQAVGLHRIYIFDTTDNLVTYGDIKID